MPAHLRTFLYYSFLIILFRLGPTCHTRSTVHVPIHLRCTYERLVLLIRHRYLFNIRITLELPDFSNVRDIKVEKYENFTIQ